MMLADVHEIAGGGPRHEYLCYCANAVDEQCPACAANLCPDCGEKCDGCCKRHCNDCLSDFEDLRLCEPDLKLAIEDALLETELEAREMAWAL